MKQDLSCSHSHIPLKDISFMSCNRLVAILTMTSYIQKDRVEEEERKKVESANVGFVCSLPPASTKGV